MFRTQESKNKLPLNQKTLVNFGLKILVVATFLFISPQLTQALSVTLSQNATTTYIGTADTNFSTHYIELCSTNDAYVTYPTQSSCIALFDAPTINNPNAFITIAQNPSYLAYGFDWTTGAQAFLVERENISGAPVTGYVPIYYQATSDIVTLGGKWFESSPSLSTSTQIVSVNWPTNNFTATSTTQHFNATVWINNVQQPNASRVCLVLYFTGTPEYGSTQTPNPQCQNIIASGYSTFTWNEPVIETGQYVWYVTIQGASATQYSAQVYARSTSRIFCVITCGTNYTPLPGIEDDTATSSVLTIVQSTFINLRGSFLDKFPLNWLIESGTILLSLPDITATSTSSIATTTIDFQNTNSFLNEAFGTTTIDTINPTINFFDFETFVSVGQISAMQTFRTFLSWLIVLGTVFYIGRGSFGLIKQI